SCVLLCFAARAPPGSAALPCPAVAPCGGNRPYPTEALHLYGGVAITGSAIAQGPGAVRAPRPGRTVGGERQAIAIPCGNGHDLGEFAYQTGGRLLRVGAPGPAVVAPLTGHRDVTEQGDTIKG